MPTIFRHKVEIGALTMNEGSVGAAELGCDVMDGWRSTAEVPAVLNKRGLGDGAYRSSAWSSNEKYLTIGGWINSPDPVSAERMRDALVNELSKPEFVITRHEAVPKSLRVSTYGRIEFEDMSDEGSRWSATVVASNPFKYSLDAVQLSTNAYSGGDFYRLYPRTYTGLYRTYTAVEETESTDPISFNNEGTATFKPVIDVYGPLDEGSWILQNDTTGESMWSSANLSEGQRLRIDMERMKADLDGYDVTHLMYGEWFGLIPGSNSVRLYASSLDPLLATPYAQINEARSAWR